MSVLRQLEFELGLLASGIHIEQDNGVCSIIGGIIFDKLIFSDYKEFSRRRGLIYEAWPKYSQNKDFPVETQNTRYSDEEFYTIVIENKKPSDVTDEEIFQYKLDRQELAQVVLDNLEYLIDGMTFND